MKSEWWELIEVLSESLLDGDRLCLRDKTYEILKSHLLVVMVYFVMFSRISINSLHRYCLLWFVELSVFCINVFIQLIENFEINSPCCFQRGSIWNVQCNSSVMSCKLNALSFYIFTYLNALPIISIWI